MRPCGRFLETDVREGDWVTRRGATSSSCGGRRATPGSKDSSRASSARLVGQGKGDTTRDWATVRALEYGTQGLDPSAGLVMAGGTGQSAGPGQFAVVGRPDAPVKGEEVVAQIRRRTGITLGGLQQALESLVASSGAEVAGARLRGVPAPAEDAGLRRGDRSRPAGERGHPLRRRAGHPDGRELRDRPPGRDSDGRLGVRRGHRGHRGHRGGDRRDGVRRQRSRGRPAPRRRARPTRTTCSATSPTGRARASARSR